MRPQRTSSVSTTTAIFITLIVAVLAFAAGTRAQRLGILDDAFSTPNANSEGLPDDLSYSDVESLYDTLRRTYDGDLTEAELIDGLKKGLARATDDPYTEYLNSEEASTFQDDLNGTFSGIGAEIGIENEVITVISPLRGFPAEKAGLRAGDAIIMIDDLETFGMSVEEAVRNIRGEKGTDVVLTILRGGGQQEITITRDSIVVPSVEWEIKNNVGVIQLSRFSDDTAKLVREAAEEFISANVAGVVLDLRNNGGGFLTSAVDVASIWLDGLTVVEQREGSGTIVTDTLKAKSGALLKGVNTKVLINRGSASASEIVAGALRDHGVAELVGETSFGKGSVQSLETLGDGGVLKVTIARWYTPNGDNIDSEGIAPDVEVEFTEEDFEAERDPQLDKAVELIVR